MASSVPSTRPVTPLSRSQSVRPSRLSSSQDSSISARIADAQAQYQAYQAAHPPHSILVDAEKERQHLTGKIGTRETSIAHVGKGVNPVPHAKYSTMMIKVGPNETDIAPVKLMRTDGGKVVTCWDTLDENIAARISHQRWDKLASHMVF